MTNKKIKDVPVKIHYISYYKHKLCKQVEAISYQFLDGITIVDNPSDEQKRDFVDGNMVGYDGDAYRSFKYWLERTKRQNLIIIAMLTGGKIDVHDKDYWKDILEDVGEHKDENAPKEMLVKIGFFSSRKPYEMQYETFASLTPDENNVWIQANYQNHVVFDSVIPLLLRKEEVKLRNNNIVRLIDLWCLDNNDNWIKED